MWSKVHEWPLIPIHTVLLPDGRVLTYGSNDKGQATGTFIYDVWNPADGASNGHMTLPNGTRTDIFCSAQLLLPDGSGDAVLVGGDLWDGKAITERGNNNSVIFSTSKNSLTRAKDMNRPRWYATMTTLPNGELFIQGGRDGTDRPEVRRTDGTFRLLSNIDTTPFDWFYPRNWVAPDGRIFGYESFGRMWYMDPAGNGTVTQVGRLPAANRGLDASAAMFEPGKILHFGGESNGALVIDITAGAPSVTATESMRHHRRYGTATLLADGKVLATGGSSVRNQLTDVAYAAEIWDPETGRWTLGASHSLARLYHSNAILLPDASVLVGGGGAPGPLTNLNVETYYPPYLFKDGKLAPRPVIVDAPDTVGIGQPFTIDFGNANTISKVALVKTGAVTHNFNMDQRYVPLSFSASGTRLTVQMPTNANDATPGYYLLFLIGDDGVPSVARIVRLA